MDVEIADVRTEAAAAEKDAPATRLSHLNAEK
jgi:hypothetical protein